MRVETSFLAVLAALTLAGCAVRAPYEAPVQRPVALDAVAGQAFTTQPYDPLWWRAFDDPVLEALEQAALAANLDVRITVARVEQARAVFEDVQLDRYPVGRAVASVELREQAFPGLVNEPIRTTTYRAGIEALWEADLFGGIRSSIRAARATADALDASLEDVRVVVAADVARNYFDLRGLQRQLEVAERSLANQREVLRLTQLRRDAGTGEEQHVASATANVAAVEAIIPSLRMGIAVQEHRLAVLAGVRPGELPIDLAPRAYGPLVTTIAVGEADDLLRRRPDVRSAERRLAAAAAREGIAAADLYPRVSLSGVIGFLAGRGNLFGRGDSRAWAVAPALSWAALDLGSARARLRGTEAATREAFAGYEQTVLRAIEETENALVAFGEQRMQLDRRMEQARASARAADLARIRYREGLSDFLALLDAERTQLLAEDGVARAEAAVFGSVVGVYKAFGGATARP